MTIGCSVGTNGCNMVWRLEIVSKLQQGEINESRRIWEETPKSSRVMVSNIKPLPQIVNNLKPSPALNPCANLF
jgi:hypothetical protein